MNIKAIRKNLAKLRSNNQLALYLGISMFLSTIFMEMIDDSGQLLKKVNAITGNLSYVSFLLMLWGGFNCWHVRRITKSLDAVATAGSED